MFPPEPETAMWIYRNPEGKLTFMGIPVDTMALMAFFMQEYGLTSYEDVLDLMQKTETALNGN